MKTNMFKRMVVAIVAIMGLSMSVNAQTDYCRISGSSDGSTATVSIDNYTETTVSVGFYNDSEQTATIIAEVSSSHYKCRVVATVPPKSSTVKTAAWRADGAPTYIKIESAKCQPNS